MEAEDGPQAQLGEGRLGEREALLRHGRLGDLPGDAGKRNHSDLG